MMRGPNVDCQAVAKLRYRIAACFLLLAFSGCRNPVSKSEAEKYLAPPPPSNDRVLVVYRLVANPAWRRRANAHFLQDAQICIDQLLDSGYTASTFFCQFNANGWYCETYAPGLYLLRSIVHTETHLVDPYVDRTYTTTDIGARFRVPRCHAIYIGSLYQAANERWTIRSESDLALEALRKIKPQYTGDLTVGLAQMENEQ